MLPVANLLYAEGSAEVWCNMAYHEFTIEGRNAVLEALRSKKPIDKLYILDGCQDGPVMTIRREAKRQSDQSGADDGRTEKARTVDGMRGYGRREDV